ncbi:MAG: DNA-processing protein DprA [Bdellovibrionales bacterium]
MQDHHGRVVYLGDSHYPKNFACMEQPPIGMTYFGNECWVQKPGVAVVGSRQPHHLTIEWLNMELSLALQTTDYYTISGGARGVDQAVHLVSLRQNTATVSFMPSGLSCLYPKSFQYWAHEITEQGGAIVSQFSPFAPMYKSHFHARNRLIAGLCDFLIVAEARCRSGSLLTAKLALEMHKNIGVVPCSPMLTTGRGGLDLIFDGAQMLRDHLDVTTWVKPGITFDS